MFRAVIFVSLLGLVLMLSGCLSIGSAGGSDDHKRMGEYYTIIETGQIINKHEDPNLWNALQKCREKAISLYRNQLNNIQKIQKETNSCLKKVGYEPIR